MPAGTGAGGMGSEPGGTKLGGQVVDRGVYD